MKRTRRHLAYRLANLLGAGATLFAFLTGVSSLPLLVQRAGLSVPLDSGSKAALGGGVLRWFDLEIQVAVALLSLPLFCLINTWFIAAVAGTVLSCLDRIGINASIPEPVFAGALLVPVAVGLDMMIMILLFGTYLRWLPAGLGLACLALTTALLFRPAVKSRWLVTGMGG